MKSKSRVTPTDVHKEFYDCSHVFSKHGLWTSPIQLTWEFVGHINPRVPPHA